MRSILIFVLVVALAVMVLGLANLDGRADIDHFFGTWHNVSLLALFAIVAGLVILVGIVAAGFASLQARRDRHALEVELQQIYVRLRTAEAALSADAAAALAVPDAPALEDAADAGATPEPTDVASENAVADGDSVDPAIG